MKSEVIMPCSIQLPTLPSARNSSSSLMLCVILESGDRLCEAMRAKDTSEKLKPC